MNKNKARGTLVENMLANILWKKGYAVIRGPASGGGVQKRYTPDLFAMKDGKAMVLEVKERKDINELYIRVEQVQGLIEFARRAGVPAYIVFKKKGEKKFYFYDANALLYSSSSAKISGMPSFILED